MFFHTLLDLYDFSLSTAKDVTSYHARSAACISVGLGWTGHVGRSFLDMKNWNSKKDHSKRTPKKIATAWGHVETVRIYCPHLSTCSRHLKSCLPGHSLWLCVTRPRFWWQTRIFQAVYFGQHIVARAIHGLKGGGNPKQTAMASSKYIQPTRHPLTGIIWYKPIAYIFKIIFTLWKSCLPLL